MARSSVAPSALPAAWPQLCFLRHNAHVARIAAALFVIVLGVAAGAAQTPASRTVILSTTTSTQDSGLLVVLVHAPSLEKKYVEEGKLHDRRLVMYNDFIVVGPEADPARIGGEKRAVAAFAKIAAAGARFVSRGDKSGTHILEQALWKQAGVTPAAPWYIESGQAMGATLGIADDRRAYTLTDRATYLAFSKRVALKPLVEGDTALFNVYSVMEVNSGPRVNAAGGKAFADFMLAPATQAVIKAFGIEKFGQPLFVPIAGKKDED